jgi:hypothetical protein
MHKLRALGITQLWVNYFQTLRIGSVARLRFSRVDWQITSEGAMSLAAIVGVGLNSSWINQWLGAEISELRLWKCHCYQPMTN